MTQRVLDWVSQRLASGHPVAVATVISATGSVPGKPGTRIAITDGEDRFGTIGGAGLELQTIARLDAMLDTQQIPGGEVVTFGLHKGAKGYEVVPLDSLCGGHVTLSMEVIFPMPHILLMGGGHVAAAVADFCNGMGWEHSVQDTREDYADGEAYPMARELHAGKVEDFFAGEDEVSLARFSHIFLLGHDWKEDEERLLTLLTLLKDGESPHIGVIGSRAKWQAFTSAAKDAGIGQNALDAVECPIGLSIGAESPEEIAIAVVAGIIAESKGADPASPSWRELS